MSGLARSFAEAGYAVLSFDFRGHGANTHRFQGDLRDDFAAAVDWAETLPLRRRRAHRRPRPLHGRAVPRSTSRPSTPAPRPWSPCRAAGSSTTASSPPTRCFVVAAGRPRPDPRAPGGAGRASSRAAGGNVVQKEIGGTDHITILRKDDTVAAVTEFLDPILGVERADGDDARHRGPALRHGLPLPARGPRPRGAARDGRGPGGARRAAHRSARARAWGGFALVARRARPHDAGAGRRRIRHPPLGRGRADRHARGAGVGACCGACAPSPGAAQLAGPRRRVAGRRPARGSRCAPSGWTGLASAGAILALLVPHRPGVPPPRADAAARRLLGRDGRGRAAVLRGVPRAHPARHRRGGRSPYGVLGSRRSCWPSSSPASPCGALPFVIALVIPLLALQYVLLELFAGRLLHGEPEHDRGRGRRRRHHRLAGGHPHSGRDSATRSPVSANSMAARSSSARS